MKPSIHSISLWGDVTALVVGAGPTADGDTLLHELGVPAPRGTLVVNGSTAPFEPGLEAVADVLAGGVAKVAVADGLTVVTGATDAGIFSMLGAAMEDASAPLIGVAPAALVTWRDGGPAGASREPLEGHHSHFVLVDGSEWGDETATMMAVATALGRQAPAAAILCGGGEIARRELLAHVAAGRPVVVMAGSGRLADEVAAIVGGDAGDDVELREAVRLGDLRVRRVADGADALAATVRGLMTVRD